MHVRNIGRLFKGLRTNESIGTCVNVSNLEIPNSMSHRIIMNNEPFQHHELNELSTHHKPNE